MEMQKGGRGGGLAEGGALGLNPPKSDRHLPLKELRCALVHKAYGQSHGQAVHSRVVVVTDSIARCLANK